MEEVRNNKQRATEVITFTDGKAHEKLHPSYTIEYGDTSTLVKWRDYQIRYDIPKKHLSIIKMGEDGIANVVAYHSIPKLEGKLYLKPDRPCFHQGRFIEWCRENDIDTVRSKKPNRTVGMGSEIFTDGTVTEITDDYGYHCRVIEDATWTILKYASENILYTKVSVYKLDLPENHLWKIEK